MVPKIVPSWLSPVRTLAERADSKLEFHEWIMEHSFTGDKINYLDKVTVKDDLDVPFTMAKTGKVVMFCNMAIKSAFKRY